MDYWGGGGGAKGMLPPSQIIGGAGPPGPPLPTPMSLNLCKMAGHALHCTKFREIISNGIKVIERTRFLY